MRVASSTATKSKAGSGPVVPSARVELYKNSRTRVDPKVVMNLTQVCFLLLLLSLLSLW